MSPQIFVITLIPTLFFGMMVWIAITLYRDGKAKTVYDLFSKKIDEMLEDSRVSYSDWSELAEALKFIDEYVGHYARVKMPSLAERAEEEIPGGEKVNSG